MLLQDWNGTPQWKHCLGGPHARPILLRNTFPNKLVALFLFSGYSNLLRYTHRTALSHSLSESLFLLSKSIADKVPSGGYRTACGGGGLSKRQHRLSQWNGPPRIQKIVAPAEMTSTRTGTRELQTSYHAQLGAHGQTLTLSPVNMHPHPGT